MFATNAKFVRASVFCAAVSGALLVAPTAQAEGTLSASAAVSNMYLWRGIDLGDGSPAVSGDIKYSIGGAYAGIWMSSGDDTLGNEYDYFVGWGTGANDFIFDISLWNYNYSDNGLAGNGFNVSDDTTGELSEIITTIGWKTIKLSYYDNIAGATGYEYWTLSAGIDKFSATLGFHDPDGSNTNDMTHLNLTYSFNDRISFTASKVIDQDFGKNDPGATDEDLLFALTYSLPIEI
ncbi:MAG: histidine kinase [Gammaproteobacteria bacterium]|nr:histidine kinase [Gammaproteobacteria bacterium]MBK9427567.1 histidine kinase [Gammaproteobacteria bacterium]